MSLFSSTALCGVLSQRTQINETLNSETFASVISSWTWKTPGTIQPNSAWSAGNGNTPTLFGGPAGGANPATGAIEANQYAYTEASGAEGVGPFTLESPVFDAGAGIITLTFHAHLAFYSNGTTEPLVATDGSLQVQGWDGDEWRAAGPTIVGTKQVSALTDPTAAAAEAAAMAYLPSSTFGSYTSSSFTNPDFRFRFRFVKGTSVDVAHYDCAVDNVKIVGPPGAVIVQPPPPVGQRSAALGTGLGTIFVSTTGNDANNGQTLGTAKRTIQAGINALQPGFVLRVQDGTYRENISINGKAGTTQNPIWIAAENPGKARIARTWQEAEEGTVTWTLVSDGVFRASRPLANRPWAGFVEEADGSTHFLFPYVSEADLRATTITAQDNQVGGNTTVTKPRYGFALQNNQVFVRLPTPGNRLSTTHPNPNGKKIHFSSNFAGQNCNITNSSNIILDGFVLEGAGNTQAIQCSTTATNITFRNLDFLLCRHAIAPPSNSIIETCHYRYPGFELYTRDLNTLEGKDTNGLFVICKGYYHADRVSAAGTPVGGGAGNALLEGSMEIGTAGFSSPRTNVQSFDCLYGPCFDGSRLGDFNDSKIARSVFAFCRDDGVQIESIGGSFGSDNDTIEECLFFNCFRDVSHQEDNINGDAFVRRCLFVWNELLLASDNSYSIKTIDMPNTANARYYHNTWFVDFGASIGDSWRLWYDFSNGGTDAISRFFNNVIVCPRDIDNGSGPNPAIIERNAVVGPSSGAVSFLTANGGAFAGTATADMKLNARFVPAADSPAAGIGRSLSGTGLVDSANFPAGGVNTTTAGCFPVGFDPGADWPRPMTVRYVNTVPSRWTSPGA